MSSISLDTLTTEEQLERGFDLCMSALLADKLYNFGELLLHPILDSLTKTKFEWLKTLILYYNSGDLLGFDNICKTKEFLEQPLLVQNMSFLRQKLCLMTLMEIVFKLSREDRSKMDFLMISQKVRIPLEEVELLVMKAFSLQLLRGKIDEVKSIVVVRLLIGRMGST